MRLLKLTATFGALHRTQLTLIPGLNILELPNEGGKSTWCAFLRAMFYGLDARRGTISERSRYTPWSGAPMEGTVELLWKDQAITLRRFPKGPDPFGGFEAVYTGTAQPVPGLTADNVGQTLLGCSKEVFQRACFIPQGAIRVGKSEDLERQVATLASSGEEDVSFSQTQRRLKDWRNAIRSNRTTGTLPRLQEQRTQLEDRRERLSQLTRQEAEAQSTLKNIQTQRQEVEDDLARHAALQGADFRRRRDDARTALTQAQAAYDQRRREAEAYGPLPTQDALRQAQGELSYLNTLDTRRKAARDTLAHAQVEADDARRDAADPRFPHMTGDQAVSQAEADVKTLTAPRRGRVVLWLPALLCAGVLLLLAALTLTSVPIPIPAFCGLAGGFLASLLLPLLTARNRRSRSREILSRYGVDTPQDILPLAARYARGWDAALTAQERADTAQAALDALDGEYMALWQKLTRFCAPFAPGASNPVALAAGLTRALTLEDKLAQARRERDAAQAVWDALCAQAPADAPENAQPPQHPLEEDRAQLARLEEAQARCRDLLARCQGEAQGLGSLEELEDELAQLTEQISAQQRRYDALTLALDALEEANAQLQTRFSPALSRAAGVLMEKLTGGKYQALTFTREFEALADAGDGPRSAQLLSQGTADQAYLALRLAICLMALPQEEPPPVILDDALVSFDDRRLRLALEVLSDLSRTRQVLLFTCQSRENVAFSP